MNSAETFDRSSLTDRVYGLVKDRILSHALGAGQKVDIDHLAAELGISRTPVKDALNRLASEGLVNVLPRRGTFIASFDLQDLLELLDVRRALESHAVRAGATRASGAQVQEMRVLLDRFEKDLPGDSEVHAGYDEFVDLDRRFHLLLVATAANRKLLEFCESLHLDIQVARAYYRRRELEVERVHSEHRVILEAFESRDPEAAARAVQYHLERVQRSLVKGDLPLDQSWQEAYVQG